MANISPITLTQLRERNINYELSPDDLFLITDHNKTARSRKEVSAAVTLNDIVNYINKHLGSEDNDNYTPIKYNYNGISPSIRYNKITNKWQFSNDGVNYLNFNESNSESSGKLSYLILDGNDQNYPVKITYSISGSTTIINIIHNLGIQPFIEIYDGSGYLIRPDIVSVNENEFKIIVDTINAPNSHDNWTLLISNGLAINSGDNPSSSGPIIDDNSFYDGLSAIIEDNVLRVKLDTDTFSDEFIINSINDKLLISINKDKLIDELINSEKLIKGLINSDYFNSEVVNKLSVEVADSLKSDSEFINGLSNEVTNEVSSVFTWNNL